MKNPQLFEDLPYLHKAARRNYLHRKFDYRDVDETWQAVDT